MNRLTLPSDPRRRRRAVTAAMGVVLAATLLLAGCIEIVSINYDTDLEAGPAQTFQVTLKFLAASSGTRAVLASVSRSSGT